MLTTSSLLLSAALLSPEAPTLHVLDHGVEGPSATRTTIDLPRGEAITLRTHGTPGHRLFLLAAPATASGATGASLAAVPMHAFLLLDASKDPTAVLGSDGRHELVLTVPSALPLGTRLALQAVTLAPAEGPWSPPRPSATLLAEIVKIHRFDLERGPQGWVGGFADYPPGQEEFYELAWDHGPLPASLGTSRSGIRMQGNNHSDDLFMFLKRRVGGLRPGRTYAVESEVELVSQYPASWLGVGGAPGSGVYLHGGASLVEPTPVLDPLTGWYVMNIAKGNQAMPGRQSAVLGHIGIAGEEGIPTLITRRARMPVLATANGAGELWLHMGTDSAFESLTEVWYDRLEFRIRALPGSNDAPGD